MRNSSALNGMVLLTAWILSSSEVLAQGTYEDGMKQLAQSINASLAGTDNRTVLVCSFRRMEGKGCNLSETITGDFEVAFAAQKEHTYKVLDRTVLDEYAKEHKLAREGEMDEEQRMKEAGKLLKADIMVFGTYRFAGNALVLRVHADDIQTSEQLAIVSVTCVPSKLLKKYCDEADDAPADNVERSSSGASGTHNEQAPATPRDPCTSMTGSYCVNNNSQGDILVTFPNLEPQRIGGYAVGTQVIVPAGGKECIYEKPAGVHSYTIQYNGSGKIERNSSIRLKACETGTLSFP